MSRKASIKQRKITIIVNGRKESSIKKIVNLQKTPRRNWEIDKIQVFSEVA